VDGSSRYRNQSASPQPLLKRWGGICSKWGSTPPRGARLHRGQIAPAGGECDTYTLTSEGTALPVLVFLASDNLIGCEDVSGMRDPAEDPKTVRRAAGPVFRFTAGRGVGS
jgi:hypothetical protein